MRAELELARRALTGDATALAGLDRLLAAEAARVAPSWRRSPDELRQALRERLLVPSSGRPPKLGQYDGSGPLSAWLRAVAVRLAVDLETAGPREALVSSLPEAALAAPSPELALLRQEHQAHFRAAFSQALDRLEPAERTALRLHALDGVSLQSIGTMFHRDASSISRWLGRIRAQLLADTREALGRRLGLEGSELESLLRHFDSQLSVSLAGLRQA